MSQTNFSKNINILLGIILVIFGGFAAVRSFIISDSDHSNPAAIGQVAGIDSSLINLINDMEKEIEEKHKYIFYVKSDPLRLSRVIVDTTRPEFEGKFKEKEEERLMRLTATIITRNDSPKAIIKFRNKSHVVQIGDVIGERYKVLDIIPKKVLMSDGAREFNLVTVPAIESGEPPAESPPEQLTAKNDEIPDEY